MIKIWSQAYKKNLEFLIEDFLEKDIASILKYIRKKPERTRQFCNTLGDILSSKDFWMDQYSPEYIQDLDHEKLIVEWHHILKPVWNKIKKELFTFKNDVLQTRRLKYHEEYGDGISDIEHYYDIKLPRIPTTITLSFEGEYITIYKRQINLVFTMVDFLDGAPLHLFENCLYCNKFIIMTRSDKKHCPICAAKKFQASQK